MPQYCFFDKDIARKFSRNHDRAGFETPNQESIHGLLALRRLGPAIVDRQIVHIHEEDSGMRMVNDIANQGSESAMVIVLPPAYSAL